MERRHIEIHGTVQGVGFRPFVFGLATRLKLSGFVRNSTGMVQIEVEGDSERLNDFCHRLQSDAPPLARIEKFNWDHQALVGDVGFRIQDSVPTAGGAVVITPDVAICDDCLTELFDPANRRFRYPFLNCTNCGPRLTIVTGSPYDRAKTTMASFPMCPECEAEYHDPANRRFHAQPTACAKCGPRLIAVDSEGRPVAVDDPVRWMADVLRRGGIGAIKGLGGYHLACDARSDAAANELRRRKHREGKPFAVMVRDLAMAQSLCQASDDEAKLLVSPLRPIVLLEKRCDIRLAATITPDGNPTLGVMIAYTPLHHLLLHELDGTPLVMTSGNRSDEPIAYQEPDVFERLRGIADAFLTSDRAIHVRCDDSVTRVWRDVESPIRRSRGYAPQPIRLPVSCDLPVLAVGGQMKNTFALGRWNQAILSHHLGDLEHFQAMCAFEKDVALYEQLFDVHPQWIAHDLHPDYASTRYALKRAAMNGSKLIVVQHHHAHMASCMAEHGVTELVIGVCFDGTGYGSDGTVWGGEFLVGDLHSFKRVGRLRCVPLPGGEAAVHEPWRMTLAHLRDADCECPNFLRRIEAGRRKTVERMIERRLNSPLTSSMGRLFDAVAALIGLRDTVDFEGQAAMQLEWLAETAPAQDGHYPWEISPVGEGGLLEIDSRPMIQAISGERTAAVAPAAIARRFHETLVKVTVDACSRIAKTSGTRKIALSGGVFMNRLLCLETEAALENEGFLCLRQTRLPPNDGGISFGQLAVAAAQIVDQPKQ
ncbi:MAG: carbamoyltransferase HypF [Phycisphaerae bacterium]|nr:carbamoyltransferase HypF [Phycisphaerae bacterium]